MAMITHNLYSVYIQLRIKSLSGFEQITFGAHFIF